MTSSFLIISILLFNLVESYSINPINITSPPLLCPWIKHQESPPSPVQLLSYQEWRQRHGDGPSMQSAPPSLDDDNDLVVIPGLDSIEPFDLLFNGTSTQDKSKASHHLKEAGITCRERTNYASLDCAASVLSHNPGTTGASSILVESKDSYMLNKCSLQNKFVVIELCDDILIDTVALANYEYFSSTFKTFRISASDRYPPSNNEWKVLGTYQAKNTRSIQAFPIESPLIWARFVKFDFLSFWDNEFYCPLSVIRVHGTTMMEEYKKEEATVSNKQDKADQEKEEVEEVQDVPAPGKSEVTTTTTNTDASTTDSSVLDHCNDTNNDKQDEISIPAPSSSAATINASSAQYCGATRRTTASSWPVLLQPLIGNLNLSYSIDWANVVIVRDESLFLPFGQPCREAKNGCGHPIAGIEFTCSSHEPSPISISTWSRSTTTTCTSPPPPPPPPPSSLSSSIATPVTQPSSPSASPTTQDSIYKTIMKRLSLLESNATTSVLYLEEQSRVLKKAFNQLQKRHSAKIDKILTLVNSTLAQRAAALKAHNAEMLTTIETDMEIRYTAVHTQYGHLISRLQSLDDEVHFQRRVFIVQTLLLIIMMLFVMFTRGPFLFDIEGTSFGTSNLFRQQRLLKSAAALEAHAARLRIERSQNATITGGNTTSYPGSPANNENTNSSSSTNSSGETTPLSPLNSSKIGES